MNLTDISDRVYFESQSHSYLLDDSVLLSGVTELMKKHGLSPDYGDIPESVLRKAAEEGTAIHREIQAYENGESIFASPLIDEYKDICARAGLKFVASEYLVSDFALVASSIDMVYEVREGEVVLVDIKTTQKYHRRALEFQLGIYRYLFEKLNPDIKVVGCACLWIDKKTKHIKDLIEVTPVTTQEVIALLDCERQGLIYVDENDTPDLGEVLSPEDAQLLAQHASQIAELEATLKVLKDADEAIRAKLLDYMESNNIDSISCPGGTFTRREATTKTTVDSKLLQEKYPAVYSKVLKTSAVKGSITYKPTKE